MHSLKIAGRLSPEMDERLRIELPYPDVSIPYLPLFIMRGPVNINCGTRFIKGIDAHSGEEFHIDYLLSAVTQQFFKPMDFIEAGWKVIAIFEIIKDTGGFASQIPIVEDWYEINSTMRKFRLE